MRTPYYFFQSSHEIIGKETDSQGDKHCYMVQRRKMIRLEKFLQMTENVG